MSLLTLTAICVPHQQVIGLRKPAPYVVTATRLSRLKVAPLDYVLYHKLH